MRITFWLLLVAIDLSLGLLDIADRSWGSATLDFTAGSLCFAGLCMAVRDHRKSNHSSVVQR